MKKNDILKLSKLLLYSFLPLLIGGLIYAGFRPRSLLMFKWFEYLNISNFVEIYRYNLKSINLPEFFIYSLPNGLWTFSFMVFIILTTNDRIRLLLLLLCLLIVVNFEIFQAINLISGTFCLIDFLTNIFFMILSLVITREEWFNNEIIKN